MDARLPRALGSLLLLFLPFLLFVATLPSWTVLPLLVLVAGLVGASLDPVVIRHQGMPIVVCLAGTTQPAGRVRLAIRAALRLMLLPLITVQALFVSRRAQRLVHDVLTGTTVTGVRPMLTTSGSIL